MQVDLRRGDILVSQQILNGPQVSSVFQQVRRKRMPQRMARHPFLDPGFMRGPFDRLIINLSMQMVPPPDSGFRVRRNLARGKQPEPLETLRRPIFLNLDLPQRRKGREGAQSQSGKW